MATTLRASTKRLLEPAFEELGFIVRYPSFRRKRDDRLELVILQHDKWGGGFFLEFAKFDSGDLHTSWGEIVPEAEIEVGHTDPATRARLLATPDKNGSPDCYFRYESFAKDRTKCDELVKQVIELLPQITAWFERGEVGPNIASFTNP